MQPSSFFSFVSAYRARPGITQQPTTTVRMSSNSNMMDDSSPVLQDLRCHLTGSGGGDASVPTGGGTPSGASAIDPEHRTAVALPVAAIKSLLGVIQRSKATTMMGLQEDLRGATEEMMTFATENPGSLQLLGGRSHIALASGCELFMK